MAQGAQDGGTGDKTRNRADRTGLHTGMATSVAPRSAFPTEDVVLEHVRAAEAAMVAGNPGFATHHLDELRKLAKVQVSAKLPPAMEFLRCGSKCASLSAGLRLLVYGVKHTPFSRLHKPKIVQILKDAEPVLATAVPGSTSCAYLKQFWKLARCLWLARVHGLFILTATTACISLRVLLQQTLAQEPQHLLKRIHLVADVIRAQKGWLAVPSSRGRTALLSVLHHVVQDFQGALNAGPECTHSLAVADAVGAIVGDGKTSLTEAWVQLLSTPSERTGPLGRTQLYIMRVVLEDTREDGMKAPFCDAAIVPLLHTVSAGGMDAYVAVSCLKALAMTVQGYLRLWSPDAVTVLNTAARSPCKELKANVMKLYTKHLARVPRELLCVATRLGATQVLSAVSATFDEDDEPPAQPVHGAHRHGHDEDGGEDGGDDSSDGSNDSNDDDDDDDDVFIDDE